MRALLSLKQISRYLVASLALLIAASCPGEARAQQAIPLQLEVFINGRPVELIASFTQHENGQLSTTPEELESLGLVTPERSQVATVLLSDIPGISYNYDAETQTINITASDERLVPREIGPNRESAVIDADNGMTGGVLNYSLSGALYDDAADTSAGWTHQIQSGLQSLSLDARVFGPLGTLTSSGFIGNGLESEGLFTRLDTAWTWSDPEKSMTYRLGDVVTKGPLFSRPLRLGGIQVRNDFSLRPDVITHPMPTFKGSVAVPSSIDVFIDNVKAYSHEEFVGPFTISNLPTVTGAGTAQIVIRDAAGRETEQVTKFYVSPSVLKGGVFDYSLEMGFARAGYGSSSDNYGNSPVGTASLRYGLDDTVTLEGHLEAAGSLMLGGAGASFTLADSALGSLSASASQSGEDQGLQLYGSLETRVGPFSFNVNSQRTFGEYRDLAALAGSKSLDLFPTGASWPANSLDPPKRLDVASVAFSLPGQADTLSLSYINRVGFDDSAQILSGSYSRPLLWDSSLTGSGFYDLGTQDTSVFVGVSMPFGSLGHGHVGYSRDNSGAGPSLDYVKTAEKEPGSAGWRVAAREGQLRSQSASVTYQGRTARYEAGVESANGAVRAKATIEGAVAGTDRGVFLSNRIDEGFAVVDVGSPGVEVLLENRKVGETNSDGLALVPGLRPYQRNRISIDPTGLPVDVSAPTISAVASPQGSRGVLVELRATQQLQAAVVVFKSSDGDFVPPGTVGTLEAAGETFVVGYDGRAYLEGLAATNAVTLEMNGVSCRSEFSFEAHGGEQVMVEAGPCH